MHERLMREALSEAQSARALGEVPIGCVLARTDDETIVARGHNLREIIQDPTAHAEMIALRAASAKLGTWRLTGLTAYVTLEPCAMCAGALVLARVDRVVYGCDDPKAGMVKTLDTIGVDARLNHRFELVPGVLATECAALLSGFFAEIRAARR